MTTTPTARRPRKTARTDKKTARISRLRKPPDLSLEEWQIALRQQFATDQNFTVRNIGGEPVFSEYHVTNPGTRRTYRVAIRGDALGTNFCSCPDFAVNTLGTCKHVEYLLGQLRRKPSTRNTLAGGYRPPFSEIALRYGARREVVFRPAPGCPATVQRAAAKCFDRSGTLHAEAWPQFSKFLRAIDKLGNGHEVRCYDDALQFVSRLQDQAERGKRIAAALPAGVDDPAWTSILKTDLYPYQRQGALQAAQAGRCLIADDMGLGKTVQAIAAAELLARHGGVRRVLIVCPTSLKHQWQMEIGKFADRTVTVVEGLIAKRHPLYQSESFYTIVNYDVIHRDLDAIRNGRFDLVVLDEAQRIKNWKTRAAKSVKQLDSDYAFVLTGTPLENRIEELYSIVEFVDRHRLGPMFRFLANHQHVDENGRVVGYRDLDKIAASLSGMLIRRTKEAVLKELPDRLEKRFFVAMTEPQARHHEENREVVVRLVAKWRRYGYLSDIDQRRMTCALQNMRMACNSTYLLDGETDFGHKVGEMTAFLEEVMENPSAKAVVFSQWLRMHELLSRQFDRRGWAHVLFHGGVPGPKRKQLISRFRDDPECRLFLATDAGGVGLNLQHAAVVINTDLPWNPAVLEQRIGRVHRLGQRQPVQVAHFIAKGTIEEGMLSLLSFKKSMFSGVLDGGEKEIFLGGTRLKRFMDTVEKATGAMDDTAAATSAHAVSTPPAGSDTVAPPPPSAAATLPALSTQDMRNLLAAGANLLHQLGQSLRQTDGAAQGNAPNVGPSQWIEQDQATGKNFLKLPLPDPATLTPLLNVLREWSHRP